MSGAQLVEECLGLLQIERVEAFSEPAVDRSEKLASLIPFTLVARQSRPMLARSSQDLACCSRATASTRSK